MTTWLYTLCGKEAQMLPYFIRHYAPHVDRMIILSGGMDEETRRIAWSAEKCEIHRSPFDERNYDDQAFVEYAATKYKEARGYADWVIWVDVDEFLHARESLSYTLGEYRNTGIRAVICEGYTMLADEFPTQDDELTRLVRTGVQDKVYNKLAAFDPMLDVEWSVGRHGYSVTGYNPVWTGMRLLHYRYFGDEWLAQRNARNNARRSPQDIERGRGYHVSPDNTGRYSPAWYSEAMKQAQVVTYG